MAYNTANITGVITYNLTSSANTSIGTTSNSGTISIGNTSSALIAVVGGTAGISLSTATTGHISINPATTGAVTLGTTSTGNVSVGNTTGTTSIQFGTGSALSTFVDWTAYTPTLDGSVSGTTTYVMQQGYYCRIGNVAICQFDIVTSAMTGTGNLIVGGFPFTINNSSNYAAKGTVLIAGAGLTWPVGSTHLVLSGQVNTTNAEISCNGTATGNQSMQAANTAITIQGTLMYRI